MSTRLLLFALIVALSSSGCASVMPPQFGVPSSMAMKQREAQRFDPYPDQQAGPEVLGGRPLDYSHAPSEPSRARWTAPRWMRSMWPQ